MTSSSIKGAFIGLLIWVLGGGAQVGAAAVGSSGRQGIDSTQTTTWRTARPTLFATPPVTWSAWISARPEAEKLSDTRAGRKSPKLAAFMSAAVPGSGQLYARSYLKAALFLGAEVGAWVAYAHFRREGIDLRRQFRSFADANWEEQRYWSWLAQESGCSVNDKNCLKEYERMNFSHHLPDEKNQEYYENIGKYDQFNSGWLDSKSGLGMQRDSANRENYTLMRKHSNDEFRRATNMSALALLNHVLSAFDAAWTSARHNRTLQASFRVVPMQQPDQALPVFAVRLTW